jgi:opacity protein-like surface antigen
MFKKGIYAGIGAAFLIGAFVSAFAIPAAAADGWYVSGNVGASALQEASITDTVTGGVGTGDADFDTGFGISGAIGHASGPFRLEGELSYRINDLDSLDGLTVNGFLITALGALDLGGDVSSFGFMANGYYDFDAGDNWAPFVMAGIGGASMNLDVTSVAGVATTYDESDTVFAYQVGAGIGYKISPSSTVDLSYRFFGTGDPTFDDGTDKIEGEYQSHNIWAGINVQF